MGGMWAGSADMPITVPKQPRVRVMSGTLESNKINTYHVCPPVAWTLPPAALLLLPLPPGRTAPPPAAVVKRVLP